MAIDAAQAEGIVARELRRLLQNLERPPGPDLGLGLQTLFAHHWSDAAGLQIEAISNPNLRIYGDLRIGIRGLMIWRESKEGPWAELFGADVSVDAEQDRLVDYTLYFGRKDKPGRLVPEKQRATLLPELRQIQERQWWKIFRKA